MSRRSRSRSRSRSRERERDIPPANTNSNDPKLLNARLFIGSLATDKVTRSELVNVFGKYGRVLGISILRGYGFIQYESEEEARAAVAGENHVMMKGQRIDVKMAVEGRKKGAAGGGRDSREGSDRRSPPPREGRGRGRDRDRDRDRERDRDRDRDRDRSPVRGRDPYAEDGFGEDGPRRPPPRDPYARDPYAAPSRFPPRGADPYADPYLARDPYARGDPYAPPPPRPGIRPPAPMVADCEIITFSPKQRSYADAIERRLRAVGVVGHQLPLSSPESLPKALEDITRRGLLFSISVNEQNEQHRSLTLNILHGTPQEHRNMPYEDAITLVQRNYEEYRKKKAEATAATAVATQDFLKPDSKQSYLLNLLADNRFLTVEEIDAVIQYLTLRREHALKKEGKVAGVATAAPVAAAPPSVPAAVLKEESAIVQQQQALQAKILNILGGNNSGKTSGNSTSSTGTSSYPAQQAVAGLNPYAPPPPPPPGQPPQTASAVSAATNINFNNPSVQKAISNLMSTGGIKSVQSAPAQATAASTAAAGGGSSYDQMYQQQYAAAYAQQQGGAQSNGGGAGAAAAANYAAAVSGYQYPGY